ncbi:hypothetical protein HNR59_002015 [Aquamicrobium lusatiense]|uniref:Uncharacterized protein n=1 Tax=Aquamicrobium lusatiense TaxID=89772 RepID=A0A7W9S2G4_9HYPH|nr:hypothetical protein [Aquamicrobium lusatiense]MBB6012670.1 hypothetical protein [Aquamicrobium lusatiense]
MHTRNQPTERGTIYEVEGSIAFVPSELRTGALAKPTETLETALSAAVAAIAANSTVYQPEAVPEANAVAISNLRTAWRAAMSAYRAEARTVAEADARARQPGPQTDAAYESRFVQSLAAMDVPKRIGAVANLSYEQSSALVRHGDLDWLELPERVIADVMERHMLLGYAIRTGAQADYSAKPSFDNPLPVGADTEAAMAAVKPQLAAFRVQADRVQLAAGVLRDVVRLAASATGKTVDATWAEFAA